MSAPPLPSGSTVSGDCCLPTALTSQEVIPTAVTLAFLPPDYFQLEALKCREIAHVVIIDYAEQTNLNTKLVKLQGMINMQISVPQYHYIYTMTVFYYLIWSMAIFVSFKEISSLIIHF